MNNEKQDPNLKAILDWSERNRPDLTGQLREIIDAERRTPGEGTGAAMLLLLTVGFAAGRQYQIDHPEHGVHSFEGGDPALFRYPVRTGEGARTQEELDAPFTMEHAREALGQFTGAANEFNKGMINLVEVADRGSVRDVRDELGRAITAGHEILRNLIYFANRL